MYTLGELPDFFRTLADRLESVGSEQTKGGDAAMTHFSGIRIKVKRAGNQANVTMRVKWHKYRNIASEDEESNENGQEKIQYKSLKKRMGKTFKAFSRDLKKGTIPPTETIDIFLKDAATMMNCLEGNSYCQRFVDACRSFKKACQSGDLAVAQTSYDHVNQLKKECHSRYK